MKFIVVTLMLCSSIGMADGPVEGSPALLRAITLCPSPNNPLDAMKALNGNLFNQVFANLDLYSGTNSVTISADVINSPNSINKSIMASDKIMGHIQLVMGYKTGDIKNKPLECKLTY
jgi:hypothetical protein